MTNYKPKVVLPCVVIINSVSDLPQDMGQFQQVSGIRDFGQAALWGQKLEATRVYWLKTRERAYCYLPQAEQGVQADRVCHCAIKLVSDGKETCSICHLPKTRR